MSPEISNGSADEARRGDMAVSPTGQESDQSAAGTPTQTAPTEARTGRDPDHRGSIEVYDEGDNIVIENRDGDVISVQSTHTETQAQVAEQAKALAYKLKQEAGPSGWTYESLKRRVLSWRDAELAKRKDKDKAATKGEPARAFRFGNTVRLMEPWM
jgi:hypothetical protein